MTTPQSSSSGSRIARQHDLKTWPEFFADLLAGRKPFELRKNDRDFQVGDDLYLHEYDPATNSYSGRVLVRRVDYILAHRPDAGCAATFGLQPGHVIMGISDVAQRPEVSVKPMQLSDDRTDYFVSISVGDREITPYVFRDEQFKAEYEAASFRWLLLGEPKPDLMSYSEDGWPTPSVPSTPSKTAAFDIGYYIDEHGDDGR